MMNSSLHQAWIWHRSDIKQIENYISIPEINPTLLEITLNVNGLKYPIKCQRLIEQLKKPHNLNYTLSIRDILYIQDTNRLKVNGWRKYVYYAKSKTERVEWLC